MYCQRILFSVFLVIYTITGLALAVVAIILYSNSHGRNQHAPQLSRPGVYYIAAVSAYILITCVIYLIARTICEKTPVVFRLAIVILGLGILVEITALAAIVFINTGIQPNIKKNTSIVTSSLTGYLIILQIYGIIASLTYHSHLRYNYEEMPSK